MRVVLASVLLASACGYSPEPRYLGGVTTRVNGIGSFGGSTEGKATLGTDGSATATLVVRVGQPYTTVAIQAAQTVNVPSQSFEFTGADGTLTVKLAPGAYYVASGLEAGQACDFQVATASDAKPTNVDLTIAGAGGAVVDAQSPSGAVVVLERRLGDGSVVALSDSAPQFGAIVVAGEYRFTASDGAASDWTHVAAGGQLSVTLAK